VLANLRLLSFAEQAASITKPTVWLLIEAEQAANQGVSFVSVVLVLIRLYTYKALISTA
jgi:hypothetical protein